MATLQKIRSKGPLLVIILGLALFAFIAEEAMRSIQSASNESRQQVGEVYGEGVSVHDFQKLVDEYLDVIKFTSGNTTFNDEEIAQIRDQVWNNYVNNQLIEEECSKLGLTVTDAEIQSIITTGSNPLLMQTPFRNEQTGRFDANLLKKFLADYESMKSNITQMPMEYIEYYQSLYKFWMFIEKSLRQDCLNQKYQTLLTKSVTTNKVATQTAFDNRTSESDIVIAALPYSTINDTEITVKESDLKAKFNEQKEAFKQMSESRDIKYIDVQVKASAADKAALDKEMEETASALAAGDDVAKIVRESGSTIAYSTLPMSKNIFPTDISSKFDSLKAGEMKAPFYYAGDNTMNIIKMIGKTTAPDSVQVRQIQVSGADLTTIEKTADSIMTALNKGIAFDSIAKKYNQTGEKTWITSRDYEGAYMSDENIKYIKAITSAPVNKIQKIDFTQGCIIAQVTDRRAMITKYNVAVIKRPIEFSKETYAKAYNDFSHFIASNQTLEEIELNAIKNGYNLLERKNMFNHEHTVAGVRSTRDILRWIFNEDTKVGDISPLYECGENDHMLLVILTGVHDAGYSKLDDVKDYLEQTVIKDKKAEMLQEKLAGVKSIAEASNVEGVVIDTIKHVTFSAPTFVVKTGSNEPLISAIAAKNETGKISTPVKGNGAVYVVEVVNKNKTAETFDAKKETAQQETLNLRGISRFINELYEKAEIEDNRYIFY